MADQNKIALELSSEQLTEFLDKCWKTPRLTLAKVQALAAQYGIAVSLMGAKSFRDTTFSRHLQRISKASELADQVRELKKAGSGKALGDAAEALVGEQLIDTLIEFEDAKNTHADGGLEALNALSKITKRLTDSERGRAALEHRIDTDKDDAARRVLKDPELLAAIAAIARDNSINEGEKIARVRKRLFGERPQNFEQAR